MKLSKITQTTTLFTWTGSFEPLGMSKEQGVAYTQEIYRLGIEMMQKTIEKSIMK